MAINFKQDMAAFAVGRRVNMEEWNTITRSAEGAIGFGVPAIPGEKFHTCLPMTAAGGENIMGITEASQVLPHIGDEYTEYDSVGICEVGVIGVLLGSDVVHGAAANFDTASKTWVSTSITSTIIGIPGAEFEEAGASGAVGAVRYRRPVPSLSVKG